MELRTAQRVAESASGADRTLCTLCGRRASFARSPEYITWKKSRKTTAAQYRIEGTGGVYRYALLLFGDIGKCCVYAHSRERVVRDALHALEHNVPKQLRTPPCTPQSRYYYAPLPLDLSPGQLRELRSTQGQFMLTMMFNLSSCTIRWRAEQEL